VRARLSAALFWGAVALAVLTLAAIAVRRGPLDEGLVVLVGLAFAVVGRLLTASAPHNIVGWVLAVIAVVVETAALTEGYVGSAPASDPLLALEVAAWLDQLIWFLWLPALVAIALPLLFPDGRLPSRRWRWIAWVGALGTLLGTLAGAFMPGALEFDAELDLENPFGIAEARAVLSVFEALGSVLTAVAVIGGGAAVIVRLRRSRGVERQQLKWFAYVASLIVAGLTVATISTAFGEDSAFSQVMAPVGWFTALAMVGIGIPVATGVAILRYRLYDIDVVINRTLVYGGLTATLVAAYVGSVLLLQLALSPLTEQSDLAIAGSTLAVAALFRPARARIQALVDRRFYRSKYDAVHTIERFGARLRDEVELDSLSAELRTVVTDTMQPAHVSLWLREAAP
jgi:hypothetical protein